LRNKQIPQTCGAGFGLEFLDQRHRLPGGAVLAALVQLFVMTKDGKGQAA
jgi:hypothetical protein